MSQVAEIQAKIEELRGQIAAVGGGKLQLSAGELLVPVPGLEPFFADRPLGAAGFLVEIVGLCEGAGADSLAMHIAAATRKDDRRVVIVDRRGDFYPPAARKLGIPLDRLVVVRPENRRDADWTLDQSMRCPGVAAVVAWPDDDRVVQDDRVLRRWQLAAEQGKTLGVLVRDPKSLTLPCWADVRLGVEPVGGEPSRRTSIESRQVTVRLLRSRGGLTQEQVRLDLPWS